MPEPEQHNFLFPNDDKDEPQVNQNESLVPGFDELDQPTDDIQGTETSPKMHVQPPSVEAGSEKPKSTREWLTPRRKLVAGGVGAAAVGFFGSAGTSLAYFYSGVGGTAALAGTIASYGAAYWLIRKAGEQ